MVNDHRDIPRGKMWLHLNTRSQGVCISTKRTLVSGAFGHCVLVIVSQCIFMSKYPNLLSCSQCGFLLKLPPCCFQNALSKTQILHYCREYVNFLVAERISIVHPMQFSILQLFPFMTTILNYLNFFKQNVLAASVPLYILYLPELLLTPY